MREVDRSISPQTAPVSVNRWLEHVGMNRGKGKVRSPYNGDYGNATSRRRSMKNWVVLFARTGSEEKLVQTLKEELDAKECLLFVPKKEVPYRSKGVVYKVRKPLFPGYVFVQTGIEPGLIADRLAKALRNVKDVYSILHYGDDKKDVVIREGERLYWEHLFDADFCVVGSVGFIEGDAIRITSGALVGLEGRIRKVNRHKREAIVEMEIMGARREVAVMLEVVEKRWNSCVLCDGWQRN